MKNSPQDSGCACCRMNRRRFLAASSAACAGAVGWLSKAVSAASPVPGKRRIRIIYRECHTCS